MMERPAHGKIFSDRRMFLHLGVLGVALGDAVFDDAVAHLVAVAHLDHLVGQRGAACGAWPGPAGPTGRAVKSLPLLGSPWNQPSAGRRAAAPSGSDQFFVCTTMAGQMRPICMYGICDRHTECHHHHLLCRCPFNLGGARPSTSDEQRLYDEAATVSQ